MISLAKSLDHSSSAAALVGPKALRPAALKSSTIPAARASSGPIKVQAISLAFAKSISLECSEIEIFTKSSPSNRIPSLPGATKTFSTFFDSSNFLAIACSRPPEPTTSSFISQPLLRIIYYHYTINVRFNLVLLSIFKQKRERNCFLPFCFLMSKCLTPVKTMVKPYLSAASIDSWSRTDPPGWIMALIPALAISSTLLQMNRIYYLLQRSSM